MFRKKRQDENTIYKDSWVPNNISDADMFVHFSKDVSFLLNTCIASAKIHKLTLEEKEGNAQIRPTLHLLLSLPTGQLKSTLLKEASNIVHQEVITETSRAGLVGAIDSKTWTFIEGQAWRARNSLMLLDEFTFGKRNKEGWEVFLQLLEDQHYSKRIGINAQPNKMEDADLYLRIDKGSIDIKTRFSCIIATMKRFEYRRGQDFRAFLTRTIPYKKNLPLEILQKVAQGNKIFIPKEIEVKQEITIPAKIYDKIEQLTTEYVKQCSKLGKPEICKEIYLRSIGDISRIYAVHQKYDEELFKTIIDWKLSAQLLVGKYFRDAEEKRKLEQEKNKIRDK